MLKVSEKYGNILVDGKTISIDNLKLPELDKYLEQLQEKQVELIDKQNQYLSQIIG